MRPPSVVFDVDGTLADTTHRQQWVQSKPKNWKAFYANLDQDPGHKDIILLTRIFAHAGYSVIICSGRPEYEKGLDLDLRMITKNWLVNNKVAHDDIFMRKAGDFRPDYVIKLELLKEVKEKWGEVYWWFDDRTQVVNAIRAAGVRVLQVAPGDF